MLANLQEPIVQRGAIWATCSSALDKPIEEFNDGYIWLFK